VKGTAARFYAGQALVVLVVDLDHAALAGHVIVEPAGNGQMYPHLYHVPLPLAAVLEGVSVPVGPDGAHAWPETPHGL
jgi:uncharacterized protein (DUF952 family)